MRVIAIHSILWHPAHESNQWKWNEQYTLQPLQICEQDKRLTGPCLPFKSSQKYSTRQKCAENHQIPFFRQLSTELSIQVRICLLSKVLRCQVTFFGHTSNSNLSYGQIHISHGGPSWFNHQKFERSPSIELLRKQGRTCSRLREPTIIKFLQNHHHFYFTRLCLPFQSSWFK